jgi:hypothetical protein
MANIGTLLQAVSAGLSGNLPQFNAQQDQRRMIEQQEQEAQQQKQQMLSKERYAAMVQDAYQLQKLIGGGKMGAAVKLLDNRIESINKLGGDPSDSLRVKDLLVSGDPAKFEQLQRGLQDTVDAGAIFWQPPEAERMTPYQQAQIDLKREQFDFKKQDPAMAAQGQAPASIQEIEYYNRLPEGPEKEAVGRKLNMISREGMDLSAYAEKQLDMASTEAATASADASRYMTLADQIKQSAMSGGLKSTWTEYIKEQTGNQDEVTGLRKQAMQIVNSEAIKNLPPGPATDRDIEIVRAPFPTEKASPEYVANWLSAVARLNEKRAQFSEFKANFISENGSLRTRSGESLISSWRKQQQEQMKSAPAGATQGIAPPAATGEPSLEDLLSKY